MQVSYMVQALQQPDSGIQEGTLSMIYKIAEDLPFQLQMNVVLPNDVSAQPADVLMPHIASLFSTSRSPDVRFHALKSFNILVNLMPEWLINNMEGYVTGLLALAKSESDARIHRVRLSGTKCQSFGFIGVCGLTAIDGNCFRLPAIVSAARQYNRSHWTSLPLQGYMATCRIGLRRCVWRSLPYDEMVICSREL
jgi:hypothetical protein